MSEIIGYQTLKITNCGKTTSAVVYAVRDQERAEIAKIGDRSPPLELSGNATVKIGWLNTREEAEAWLEDNPESYVNPFATRLYE